MKFAKSLVFTLSFVFLFSGTVLAQQAPQQPSQSASWDLVDDSVETFLGMKSDVHNLAALSLPDTLNFNAFFSAMSQLQLRMLDARGDLTEQQKIERSRLFNAKMNQTFNMIFFPQSQKSQDPKNYQK